MKWTRATVTWLVLLLLCIITYAAVRIASPGRKNSVYTVSVIVENSSSNRWRSFREGLNQYAAGENVIINFVSTSDFEEISDLTDILRREQSNGADGLIVYPGMNDQAGVLSGLLTAVPSVLVGTGLSGEEYIDVVEPDGSAMGQAIAQLLLEYGDPDDETAIGVLSGNQQTVMMQDCLSAFMAELGDYADQVQWTLSEQALSSGNLLGFSMEAKPVDVLIALDNQAMETAVSFVTASSKYTCSLYGQGRSEQCIYFLNQGVIGALAVPDEFMMGYESMALLMQKMSLYSPASRSREIQILSVTRENLFDDDIAGILFPTVS